MDLNVRKGRTARWLIGPLLNSDESTFALANITVRFMAKALDDDPDVGAVLDHHIIFDAVGAVTTTTGAFTVGGTDVTADPPVVYSGSASGVLTLRLQDEDTQGMDAAPYPWEMVMFDVAGDVYQLYAGILTIEETLIDDPETL